MREFSNTLFRLVALSRDRFITKTDNIVPAMVIFAFRAFIFNNVAKTVFYFPRSIFRPHPRNHKGHQACLHVWIHNHTSIQRRNFFFTLAKIGEWFLLHGLAHKWINRNIKILQKSYETRKQHKYSIRKRIGYQNLYF